MELNTVMVRHSMLRGAYVQLKNYLDCVERGYLGVLLPDEQDMVKELKKTTQSMENTLKYYFDTEERMINP